MSVLILKSGALGPFKSIEVKEDRLTCDCVDYPFVVIGEYSISEDDSLAPPPSAPPRDVKAEIAVLESQITQRRLREAVLGVDNGWLATKELEIQQLRGLL